MCIARQHGQELSEKDVQDMTWEDKCSWLRRNPVTAARLFQFRLEIFFKLVISEGQVVGQLSDYLIRIEFQQRGSPHAHCLLWVKDAPLLDVDSDQDVCTFIDRYQHCRVPDDEELALKVLSLQKHTHSPSCRRNNKCRFRFPQPPSLSTLIAREPDVDPEDEDGKDRVKHLKEVLKAVKKLLDTDPATHLLLLSDLLHQADVTEQDYQEALGIAESGKRVVVKRNPSEVSINHYNPWILRSWAANMDLQFVTDAYAAIMYITSYMLKAEKNMSELLQKVGEESREADLNLRQRMSKLGSTFLNKREVSAQEAAYRLLSMPLKLASRKVVFVNTSPRERCVHMVRPLEAIQAAIRDKQGDVEDSDLYYTGLLERYAARPDSLEGMCLAQFAASYDVTASNQTDDDHNIDVLEDPDQHLHVSA